MRVFLFLSFFIFSIFLCGYYNESGIYSSLTLLPVALMLFYTFGKLSFPNLTKSYVYYIFYFQAIVRYIIIPIGIAQGHILNVGQDSENISTAVFFMIVELLAIFMLFAYQNHKFEKDITTPKLKLVNNNFWIYLSVLIMFIVILNSGFFGQVNFVWNLSNYVENVIVGGEKIESTSLGGLLFIPFKIALLLLAYSFILRSNTNSFFKVIYIVIIIGISSSFIVGVSRLSIFMLILPFYLIVATTLDEKIKKIVDLGLIGIAIPILLLTSIVKFTRSSDLVTAQDIFNTSSFNAYFAGVGNVAAGIDAFEEIGERDYARFFINDIFQNVPVLSRLTDNAYKSNYVFNEKIYGHREWQTQIVPLSIAGLFHFNILGIGVYSCIFLAIAFYFERKARVEPYLAYKYVFFSIMLTLSMVFMLNIGSMVATLIRSFFFIYMPFYISDKLYRLQYRV